MFGHRDVHDAPAVVRDNHQDEQEAARRGRDDEEIRCGDLLEMVGQECPPRL
jgi:hypothetical protein